MDQIKEMLNSLSELDDAQVEELKGQINSEFDAVESEPLTKQTVDAMTSLAEMFEAVEAESARRAADAQELATLASEAACRVRGDKGVEETAVQNPEDEEEVPEAPAPADVVPAEGAPVDAPSSDEGEVPSEDTAPADEMPSDEDDEDKDKEEMFSTTEDVPTDSVELSVTEETAELSTDEAASTTEEPVVAAAEEVVETPALDTTAELSVEGAEEAAVEVAQDAELSTTETTETVASTEEAETTIMEAPVTAAAENAENLDIEVPADRRPTPKVTVAPVAITAGADVPGYTAGSPLNNMDEVAEAMVRRIHSVRHVNGGDGEQHIVASLTTQYPDDRVLGSNAEENWSKIQNVVGPEAIVAAGGFQAPHEVRYEIFGFGTTDRPVRDSLPRFQADRGGIRYITPPVLTSYDNAVGVWTSANDAAETPSPSTKASLTVAPAQEVTVSTDAVTLQMQFGNLMTRAYPELVARHNELGLIQHAREAEQYLLGKIAAGSTAVTTSSLIGFARDYLVQIGRAGAAYRSRWRLDPAAPLRVIAPAWVKDAMVADLTLSMPGDSTLNATGEINGYLSARGVNITWALDQNVYGSQGATALLEFSDSFTWYIFAEGTFLFLDGGTLDLGIIRDSSLVGTNDYKMFLETFEGIAKVGIESLAVTSSISVNGVAAALRDTTGGATAAAIEY